MADMGCEWRIAGSAGTLRLRSAAPDMPAMEALTLSGAPAGEAMRDLPLPPELDCPAIPREPLRYSAYPGVEASRDALVAIGTLYQNLGEAIHNDGPVFPDFAHALAIQRLVANIDAALIADGT